MALRKKAKQYRQRYEHALYWSNVSGIEQSVNSPLHLGLS